MRIHLPKRLLTFLGIASILLSLNGCDNTLHVTAEWKEIPVVYGLLNPSGHYNYIRINRAYLNETGDAVTYASTPDSIQFEDLTVTLVERQDGIERNTITFQKVNGDTIGLPKEEGIFAQSPNILYRTSYKIQQSDFSTMYNYELVIVNNKSGKVYRSNANMIGETEMFSPVRDINPRINITDDTTKYIYVDYREASQAKMYDCVLRLRYKEYPKDNPSDVHIDSVSWTIFKNRETIKLFGYEQRVVSVKSYLFYDYLNAAIEADPNIQREAIDAGFYMLAGGEDLFTYIEVNKPSIGIVQKKPEFTNIQDGLGIFSSLHIKAYDHVIINEGMLNTLATSDRIAGLNFVIP